MNSNYFKEQEMCLTPEEEPNTPPVDPEPSTEETEGVIKPGGEREKNPKKM